MKLKQEEEMGALNSLQQALREENTDLQKKFVRKLLTCFLFYCLSVTTDLNSFFNRNYDKILLKLLVLFKIESKQSVTYIKSICLSEAWSSKVQYVLCN